MAGLAALALATAAAGSDPLAAWPTPLGLFPVAGACGLVIYLALRRTSRRAQTGVEVRPMRPDPTPTVPPALREALEAARQSPTTEEMGPVVSNPLPPRDPTLARPSSLPVLHAPGAKIPFRRGYSAYVVPKGPSPPGGPLSSRPPPPSATGFGWRMLAVYALLAVPLLGASPFFLARVRSWTTGTPFPSPAPPSVPYLFTAYDRLVQAMGQVVFWPQPWPGPPNFLQGPNVLEHTAADYIFTMYLVLLLAFILASGLASPGRYTRSQRGVALGLLGGYVLTALLTEVFFYAIRPSLFYSSLALLGRAFVGGLFFAFLLFSTLVAPPIMTVRPRLARRPREVWTFVLTCVASVTAAFALLYAAYAVLGLGRDTATFVLGSGLQFVLQPLAILLLLPLTALTLWAMMGRLLYARELRARPVPPVSLYHPPVSILIPAYNEEATIAATIRSADRAARLYPGSVEIVVGNDGSIDRTSEMARGALGRLHHAHGRVLDLPHGGKSNALNGALRACRGEVIVRVDADTRMSPEHGFSAMVTHFADPEVGGVQGLILPLQRAGWTRKLRMLEIVWNHLFLRRATYATRTAQVVDGAFCAFRREDILTVGGWVPWNGEDTEITYRLQRIGYRFRYETRAVSYEDVPATYRQLKKQRVRWTRGGYFAHHRHYGSLLSDAPEFGGLAVLYWLVLFIRAGMRHMVYIYAVLMTLLLGLQTIYHIGIILALLLLPRGLVMAYYLVRIRAASYLPWIAIWPLAAAVKQFITMEGYGTILPGAIPEFSE